MPGCKAHPGNGVFLPAQPKLPPGAILFLTALLLKVQGGKKVTPRPGQLHKAVYPATPQQASRAPGQPGKGGEAGRAASAVPEQLLARQQEQTATCPRQPRAGTGAPASSSRQSEGNRVLMVGRDSFLQTEMRVRRSIASPKARLAPANTPRWLCEEPRHTRGIAATRLGGRGGTRSCRSPGPGPERIAPLEGLPSPAAHGRGKPSVAGSLPPPAKLRWLLRKVPPCFSRTGMLPPHHPPGFAPARNPPKSPAWQSPRRAASSSRSPTHQRDISMPSLQAQDASVRHRPFAAERKGNIWPDAAQQHRTGGSCLADSPSWGAREHPSLSSTYQSCPPESKQRPPPQKKTPPSMGTYPGHSRHPSHPARCKQAPGKPAVPRAQEVPKTSRVPQTCSGDGDISSAPAQPPRTVTAGVLAQDPAGTRWGTGW